MSGFPCSFLQHWLKLMDKLHMQPWFWIVFWVFNNEQINNFALFVAFGTYLKWWNKHKLPHIHNRNYALSFQIQDRKSAFDWDSTHWGACNTSPKAHSWIWWSWHVEMIVNLVLELFSCHWLNVLWIEDGWNIFFDLLSTLVLLFCDKVKLSMCN